MSQDLNVVKDADTRKVLKHAEEQGFVISKGGHGVIVRKPPTEDKPKGEYVCSVTSTPSDWRALRNTLAELRRHGYDPNWVKPKTSSSAYKIEERLGVDAIYVAPILRQEIETLEAWQAGPFKLRVLTFLELHPNTWWSAEALAGFVGWTKESLGANGTHICRQDPHIRRANNRFMWDCYGFGPNRTEMERRRDMQRATGSVPVPNIDWKEFDTIGRLVGVDDEGQEWYAVPKGMFDN